MILRRLNNGQLMDFYSADISTELPLLLALSSIPAGFPSPADDYLDLKLDLNKELVNNPNATFYARVKGTSMQDAGIQEGDVLVIDRSLEAKDNDIAVCYVDGEFTVKRIRKERNAIWLLPANRKFKPIKITEENDFMIWGVVTYVIHKY
jgi:DNA polymerase V